MEILDDTNFMLYAAQSYENIQCHSTCEFIEDIRRIKYIKKLLTRYLETGELKERLILNHFIILNNVFDTTALIRMLFLKMDKYLPQIKPFLIFLSILPKKVSNIKKKDFVINTDDIPLDQGIVNCLRKI